MPNCKKYKGDINQWLDEYTLAVKNFTDAGQSATQVSTSLMPLFANIIQASSSLIAVNKTASKIYAANKAVPTMPTPSTIPSSLYSQANAVYKTNFEWTQAAASVFAYQASVNLLQTQYIASFNIYQFCAAFQFANANNVYSECSNFGNTYVPTPTTFSETFSTLLSDKLSTSDTVPPPSVGALNNNIGTHYIHVYTHKYIYTYMICRYLKTKTYVQNKNIRTKQKQK